MKVVHAASEMFPFVKTGGLADVCGSLFKSLASVGHEVSFFLPGYRKILESKEFEKAKLKVVLQVELGEQYLRGEVWELSLGRRQTLYIIRRDEFFDRTNLYGTRERDYDDNDRRYIYFCKAVVQAMRLLGIKADILHCHDWQAGLLPLFLRMEEQANSISLALKTFFSIHNLAFQGLFPQPSFELTNLPDEFNAIDGLEFYKQISMIKGGIFFADKIMTVSQNYAREILTPRFGCGLEGALKVREDDLVGIANGIDTEVWNPKTDPCLPFHYSAKDLSGKAKCKAALLEKLGLPVDASPVFGMVCRLTEQKGLDLLLRQLNFFAKEDCKLVLLGKGDPDYEKALKRWAKAHPNKVGLSIQLDEAMSHLVEAGSDFFLMPSIFEPCGLNQMYSQRYGTVPLVSGVGGLKDTVIDIVEDPESGTGIVFEPNDVAFRGALRAALKLFADKKRMAKVIANGMGRDFSWKRVTAEYEALYRDSI
ncbi:glycogen synthase GlgA [Pelagicoccus sp. SDUM812003]|uniref:glycogen synthase GlgA n=1 Tax=Pelagicoccus sp. SDUM812003 TaxID=3041267 RepID=UPI00280D9857|nr:glycogen synthase GlgA [Pelagicoccus sp. SDUM812003]MDQ8203665.1 glycogen synthase GlgA [Pelagicoccus sp. SDUM812003]